MSFQPNNKNNKLSPVVNQDEQHVEFDSVTDSSQLENILGRINAIMTEGTSEQTTSSKSQAINHQHTNGVPAEPSLNMKFENQAEGDVGQANLAEPEEKFQPSEPLDMLQPYSEVLNEVRDYFNERHSLDPNDSLVATHKKQSITDEVIGRQPIQQEEKNPKKVLLWGETPLDAQNTERDTSSYTPAPSYVEASTPDVSPADFGFGQTDAAPFSPEPQKHEIAATPPADLATSIFSPIAFENPFARDHSRIDVLGPVDNSGQFKQLRHELVDRIAQLEQVIGHHFGDRKEVANEAAQAAIKLTLKDLDDTSLGRRLSDIETAFLLYQENQSQKNNETKEIIEKFGAALLKMETVAQIADNTVKSAKISAPVTPVTPESTASTSVMKTAPEAPVHNQAPGLPEKQMSKPIVADADGKIPVRDKAPNQKAANKANAADFMIDEIQVPLSDRLGPADKNGKQELSSESSEETAKIDVKPPLLSPEDLENFVADPSNEQKQEGAMGSIDQLRKSLSSSSSERSFGNNDKYSSGEMGGQMPDGQVQAQEEQNLNVDKGLVAGNGLSVQPEQDKYLTKSATLRDQFNRSEIISKDKDLEVMRPRGVRVVVLIMVITLCLAATGIAFRNDEKGLQNFIFNFVTMAKGLVGADNSVKKVESAPEKNETGKSDSINKGTNQNKSNDRLGTLMGDGETKGLLGNSDPAVTGNIGQGLKPENGISLEKNLLNGVAKLGMPPALIGPYSLRHAAARGDVLAEYEVARRFSYGIGIPKDPEQAVKWYMQGASKGFAPSQYRLATYYERGRGIEKNLGRAKAWYQRAAMLGNVKAMHNLAVISTALDKDSTDYKTAIYWFRQAANRNLADSQFNLAILYHNGVGLSKNNVEAYKWFSLAARQGDVDASSRRDTLEKKLKKEELLSASKLLQKWKPLTIDSKANDVGRISAHLTSTMSHANETISRSRVLTTQILLRKLGYGLRNADGAVNEETIRAIKKFEKDKGLPITGKINQELIQILNKASL